jgi:HPr kinase/phosphorylase
MSTDASKTIHANCVAIDGKGLLIIGASGTGKSTLALQMLGLGADLVSDDRTTITKDGQFLRAEAPFSIQGLIETRGLGILTIPNVSNVLISAVVDLDQVEAERLPPSRIWSLMGISLPCLHKVVNPAFPVALLHYLRNGRQDVA